jgi:Mg2+ and Co2+ transporter CorA
VFRTLELRSDGSVQVARGLALVNPPPLGAVRWVDLTDPSDALLALLGERFGFQALTLEACAHAHPRSKVEAHEDHLVVATCGFAPAAAVDCTMRWQELHAFVSEQTLFHIRDLHDLLSWMTDALDTDCEPVSADSDVAALSSWTSSRRLLS